MPIVPAFPRDLLSAWQGRSAALAAHGPWPPPPARDASNRVSGRQPAIALGERLFFSPRLSGSGTLLCASCHQPWRDGADGRARALGLQPVDRNTPSLANVALNRWFGWDGANDTLWGQSLRPLLDAREMHSSAARIGAVVRGDAELSAQYRLAFGAAPPADDEALLVDVGKALAAYQETLVTGRTPFDEFRDAVVRADAAAAARYPADARRGLAIFLGKGACAACHAGPAFSDGQFHRVGTGSASDRGRSDGINRLLASRYTLSGPYSDAPSRPAPSAAREKDAGSFRTPGLRNVALTAPYMHDGSVASLCELVKRHPPDGIALSAGEQLDLIAFLGSLNEAGKAAPACR